MESFRMPELYRVFTGILIPSDRSLKQSNFKLLRQHCRTLHYACVNRSKTSDSHFCCSQASSYSYSGLWSSSSMSGNPRFCSSMMHESMLHEFVVAVPHSCRKIRQSDTAHRKPRLAVPNDPRPTPIPQSLPSSLQ